MALRNFITTLLLLLGSRALCVSAVVTLSSETCSPEVEDLPWLPDQATICSLSTLGSCQTGPLSGNVLLTGALEKTTWDLSEDGDGALILDKDASVIASCLSVLLDSPALKEMQMQPLDLSTIMSPPFLRSPAGPVSNLTMRDVEIKLSCSLLLEWQSLLCGIRLPGMTKVQGNSIFIEEWRTGSAYLNRVSLTCDPGSAGFTSACSMATVDSVDDVLSAAQALQEPSLPLVLTVSRGLNFTDANWPAEGVRITANVTLSATLNSTVAISFGLKTVLFTVDSKSYSTAFLSFRGCILKDLPLSYLPLDHPRRPFGILSTGMWPVYREEVAMGLYNCTLILTNEEFLFWSFWLSILISPIPSVRALANWSYATGVQLEPSGSDYIMLSSYYGRYTTLVDVRYQVSNSVYTTLQRKNILQITGNAQVPPTVVFQVRDSADLLNALSTKDASSASQHGQYIILTDTISLANITGLPRGGTPIQYPTTLTTWPSSTVAFDLGLAVGAFAVVGTVAMKNLVLANLALGGEDGDFNDMATGLWAFNFSNWRYTDQSRLSLESCALVVGCQEVEYYLMAAVDGTVKADTWVNSFKVNSYDIFNRTWVSFAALSTLRFTGQKVNITCTMPVVLDGVAVSSPVSGNPGGLLASMDSSSSSSSDRQEILLFSLLAITLPTALGAALFTFLVVKRRRLRQLCTTANSSAAVAAGDEELPAAKREKVLRGSLDSSDPEADDEPEDSRGGRLPAEGKKAQARQNALSCCLRIPLPLRKSKFVNPLYEDANSLAPEVVLTGVLGPTSRGRRAMVPPPVELPAVMGTEALAAPAAAAGSAGAIAAAPAPSQAGLEGPTLAAVSAAAALAFAAGSGQRDEPVASDAAGVAEVVQNAGLGVVVAGEVGAAEEPVSAAAGTSGAAAGSGAAGVSTSGLPVSAAVSRTLSAALMPSSRPGTAGSGIDGMAGAGPAAAALAVGSSPEGEAEERGARRSSSSALGRGLMGVAAPPSAYTAATAAAPSDRPRAASVGTDRLCAVSVAGAASLAASEGHPRLQRDALRDAGSGVVGGDGGELGRAASGAAAWTSATLANRRQSSREAGPGPRPAMPDMRRLERLQRDIGDQHLEVQHSLGWGGCGVVYKGIWKGLQVAVKTVLLQGDNRQSRQFLTEAAISASLQHANVVTTYLYELRPLDEVDPPAGSSGVEIVQSRSSDGSPDGMRDRMACWKLYIVQEYCELGTLKAAIDQGYFKGPRGGLPNMPFLLTIALDVANGLMHVHSKNVVHGDVTVSNVLLQTCPGRPQGCIAKVADFGLSVKFEAGQSHNSHMYGGTPHYMAPERSRGVLSKESDIYSLGVCLWEVFCGTPPWRRNTAGAHNNRRYPGTATTTSSMDSGGNLHSYNDLYGSGGSGAGGDGGATGGGAGGGGDVFHFPRSCPSEYSSLVLGCLSSEMGRRPTAAAVVAALQRLHRRYC